MFRPVLPILLLLLLLPGCGKKGPVRPLSQPLPAAPGKLAVRQLGMRFLLAWDLPQTNQNDTPLTDLEGFRIYKMQYDLAEDCPDCRDTSVLLDEVDLDYPENARRSGDRVFFWDAELRPGSGYQYRVVPLTRRKREGAPTQVRLPFSVPPLAPARAQGSGHDRLVRLSWEPADGARQAGEWLGYNLYRRLPDEPFPTRPLNKAPLAEPAYQDYQVENGRTYLYAVRSVARLFGEPVESPLSTAVEVVPREGL